MKTLENFVKHQTAEQLAALKQIVPALVLAHKLIVDTRGIYSPVVVLELSVVIDDEWDEYPVHRSELEVLAGLL